MIKKYIKEAIKYRKKYGYNISILNLVRFFPKWKNTLINDRYALKDEIPWITFSAIDYCDQIIDKSMRVFEYGSGGSTLYFADRVKHLISVEHDKYWHSKVQRIVNKRKIGNIELILREPQITSDASLKNMPLLELYRSNNEKYNDKIFDKYASEIDRFPDFNFDLIFVDGRARKACIHHAAKKVKKGGMLILDNSEREEYFSAIELLNIEEWARRDFYGPGPYNKYFWQTSVWIRR